MAHRWKFLLGLCLLAPCSIIAQWTPAAPMFPGANYETHPAFVRRLTMPWYGSATSERLVFTQATARGSRIVLAHTESGMTSWDDSLEDITGDSVLNDFATAATAAYNWSHDSTLMVLWEAGCDSGTIWYRYFADTAWREPARLTIGSAHERRPCIAPMDSGYLAVWESHGRIVFSAFLDNAWSKPEYVTPAEDSANSNPQVCSVGDGYHSGTPLPMVLWEHRKEGSDSCEILYALRRSAGWSKPDTIGWTGDNRRPRFSPSDGSMYGLEVSYESNRSGLWDIYSAFSYWVDSTSVTWNSRDTPENPGGGAENHDATLFFWPIITAQYSGRAAYPNIAGVWISGAGHGDSVALSMWSQWIQYQTVSPGSTNKDPVLSCGIWRGGYMRLWSVWENNATGSWKLVESHVDLDLGAVDDEPAVACGFELEQNYPNPFNPTTGIRFQVSGVSDVKLVVYDVIGREVATLVNEVKQPGRYTVTWDASKFASGMYLVRLTAGKFTATRKILLLR